MHATPACGIASLPEGPASDCSLTFRACRLRSRQMDWRHKSKRTSFDGMHASASSDDDDPVAHLPEARWALKDVHDGRPDGGSGTNPLDRVKGTFDSCLPASLNTLSSAYKQTGVDAFRKRIQHHSDGSITLDLSGRIGCAAQLELLPAMLQDYHGRPLALLLANNALKPDSLPALSGLVNADSMCSILDLSRNDALLSSPLCCNHRVALAAFFTACTGADTAVTENRVEQCTGWSTEAPIMPTPLSALVLDACNIHHSTAEALAHGLLQQCAYIASDNVGNASTTGRGDAAGRLPEISAPSRDRVHGLCELHLEQANLDEAAFMCLISPAALPQRYSTLILSLLRPPTASLNLWCLHRHVCPRSTPPLPMCCRQCCFQQHSARKLQTHATLRLCGNIGWPGLTNEAL